MIHAYLFILLLFFCLPTYGDTWHRTAMDMYRDSYMAATARQSGMGIAEARAEEYRRQFEVCDEHHNCEPVAEKKESPEKAKNVFKKNTLGNTFKPYWQSVWE